MQLHAFQRLQTLEELTGMGKQRSEMEDLARQLYRDHKKVLGLLTERSSGSGFELAVQRLFGDNPEREKPVKVGNSKVTCSGIQKSLVSFLPARWHEELDKTKGTWPGCDNWWAGYPFIAWVEIRAGDDGTTGILKLNAEVGPISNHKARKGIIEAIQMAASAQGLERIQFPVGASDERGLYSRFLRKNSIAVKDIRETDGVESKIVQLMADFEPEFDLVASVIPQFLRFKDVPVLPR
jgi:hypothetical protein